MFVDATKWSSSALFVYSYGSQSFALALSQTFLVYTGTDLSMLYIHGHTNCRAGFRNRV